MISPILGNEVAPSITLSDISIQLNSRIVVEAVVYGYPTPNVTWFKVYSLVVYLININE